MERLVLIKESPAIQVGHLYEHIFCARIDALFHEHHLFPHLDYSLVGKTYYGGIVSIDLELYTNDAISVSRSLPILAIDINEDTVSVAVTQILAEKEVPLASDGGFTKIKQALEELHTQPWQNIDDIELIDTKKIRKQIGAFYISEGKVRPARKLATSISIDTEFSKTHRELLPLFRQFAWLITASLQGVLADTYGCFSQDDTYKNSKDVESVVNTFRIADTGDSGASLTNILATCLRVTESLQQYDTFKRLMNELRRVSYRKDSGSAPNLERNYEDTLVFIGPKGWQKIATTENCSLLLKHMSIEVKLGQEKISQTLYSEKDSLAN